MVLHINDQLVCQKHKVSSTYIGRDGEKKRTKGSCKLQCNINAEMTAINSTPGVLACSGQMDIIMSRLSSLITVGFRRRCRRMPAFLTVPYLTSSELYN